MSKVNLKSRGDVLVSKGFLKRHPITGFFVFAFIIGAAGYFPWVLSSYEIIPFTPIYVLIGGTSPLIAAIIMSIIAYGKVGLKYVFGQFTLNIRSALPWIILALLYPFGLHLASIGLYIAFSGSVDFTSFTWVAFIPYFLITFLMIMGEEWGWRAFALPHLQKKHNALLSSIILGIMWTLWHWPHFLLKDSTMNSLYGSFLIFSFSILLDSILYTWLYNSGKGNMFTAIVLHASVNAMIAVNLPNTINFQLIVKLVIVLIVILVFKWNILSRDSKIIFDQIIEHYGLKEEVRDQKKNS